MTATDKLRKAVIRRRLGQAPHWSEAFGHSPYRTGLILNISPSQVYKLLHEGRLRAVNLANKTTITTESILDFLQTATPWKSDRTRVERAISARPDVIRRREQAQEAARLAKRDHERERKRRKAEEMAARPPAVTARERAR